MAFSVSPSQLVRSPLSIGLSLPRDLFSKLDQRGLGKNTISIQLPVTGFLMTALKVLFKCGFL